MNKDKLSYNILVIEDNAGDLGIVEAYLNEQILRPDIVSAVNFKQACAILSSKGLPFDVILLDITLPDKSGPELINHMLLEAGDAPIIILTGFADVEFSIRSIASGISDYLFKDDLTPTVLYKSILYAINRKKNISELKESENRYSSLFNASPQPMWVFDPETFRFSQVNKAAIALYGYTQEEFMNMTLWDIKLKEDVPNAKASLTKLAKPEDIFHSTIVHQKKSGELMEMEIYSTPVIIGTKTFRTVIAIDVTAKNLYEHTIIKAIIQTQENERYEIGAELHDNVCQLLATGQLTLGLLGKKLNSVESKLFGDVSKYLKLAIDEIRNLSHRLAPAFFDDSTLKAAFEALLESFNPEAKYKITLHFNPAALNYKVSLEIQLNLYRMLQEQLRNIEKYAKANLIEVDVIIHHHRLVMRVADDGIGFDMNLAKKGIGLANIKRRTELFYGKYEITSACGSGCEIIVTIPLPDEIDKGRQSTELNYQPQTN